MYVLTNVRPNLGCSMARQGVVERFRFQTSPKVKGLVRTRAQFQRFLTSMARLFAAVAIILALLATRQGHQHPFVPLPTGPMPVVLIP
jgi:hypothetical protein